MTEPEEASDARVARRIAEVMDTPIWPVKAIAIGAWIVFAILAFAATYVDFAAPGVFEIQMHGREGPWLQGKEAYLFSSPVFALLVALAFSYQAKHWKAFERRSELVQGMYRRALTRNPTMNVKQVYFAAFAGIVAVQALVFGIGIYRCYYVLQLHAAS